MRKLTLILALTALALLSDSAPAADMGCDAGMRAGSNRITVTSGGREQRVELVLPASFERGKPVPLVIGLHPSSGTGAVFEEDTGMRAAASAKGFAVIFPDGAIRQSLPSGGEGNYWNIPGVPLIGGGAVPAGTRDDVRFLADVIDHVVKHNCIDARRVFVTGMSGGARMSSMLGCRLADRITAIAPVAGVRAGRAAAPAFEEPDPGDCQPSRPLSVLAVHATEDPTNPFPGGDGLRWGYSVERAMARWASLDHCEAAPTTEKVSPQVSRVRYATCGVGSEVVLYRIDAPRDQGGGHVWPGGQRDASTRSPAGSAGSATDASVSLDATQLVLDFFARH